MDLDESNDNKKPCHLTLRFLLTEALLTRKNCHISLSLTDSVSPKDALIVPDAALGPGGGWSGREGIVVDGYGRACCEESAAQ